MSNWTPDFSERLPYSDDEEGITVEVFISSRHTERYSIDAKLDTGSTFCIFQPYYASLLGIDLKSGEQKRIRTATGSFGAYGHEVTLTVGNLEWQAAVYFAADEAFPMNVVGRVGFLD